MRFDRMRALKVLAATVVVALAGAAAQAVTVDGVISSGEWDDAPVVITDPNETSIPDSYDVEQVMIMGGLNLYIAVEVWNDTPLLTPAPPIPTGRAFLNFDWNTTDGGVLYFGVTLNDHKGFAPGELHVIQYTDATRTTFVDLGLATYVIGTAIEMSIDWSMLPGVDVDDDGYVTFSSFSFLYNNGGLQPDDDSSNSTIERNDPVPVIPEPLTLTGLVMAAGLTLPRLLRRQRSRNA